MVMGMGMSAGGASGSCKPANTWLLMAWSTAELPEEPTSVERVTRPLASAHTRTCMLKEALRVPAGKEK